MTRILAIDPGNIESGWCVIDVASRRPVKFGKTNNVYLRQDLRHGLDLLHDVDHVAIEMVQSFGMTVGRSVFETCVEVGRLSELLRNLMVEHVYRKDVVLHHCNHPRGNDATVKQALVDRFAPNTGNHGKGTKAQPGWFHGFARDVWSAYAIAVYVADRVAADEAVTA